MNKSINLNTEENSVQKWRRKTKNNIIKGFDSKCQICGYNRSINALELHHLNPKDKNFAIANALRNPKSWEVIKSEVKKCILLCVNCHREVHRNIIQIENKLYFKEEIIEDKKYNICPVCGNKKKDNLKFCSNKCSHKKREKVEWDKINLLDLLNEYKNAERIGKYLGVSGGVIRKRLNKLRKKND